MSMPKETIAKIKKMYDKMKRVRRWHYFTRNRVFYRTQFYYMLIEILGGLDEYEKQKFCNVWEKLSTNFDMMYGYVCAINSLDNDESGTKK